MLSRRCWGPCCQVGRHCTCCRALKACTMPPKHLRICSTGSNACQEPGKPSVCCNWSSCATQPAAPSLGDNPRQLLTRGACTPERRRELCSPSRQCCHLHSPLHHKLYTQNFRRKAGGIAGSPVQHRLTSKDGSPPIECYAQCLPVVKVLLYHLWKPLQGVGICSHARHSEPDKAACFASK